jgi:hypothetical protein
MFKKGRDEVNAVFVGDKHGKDGFNSDRGRLVSLQSRAVKQTSQKHPNAGGKFDETRSKL